MINSTGRRRRQNIYIYPAANDFRASIRLTGRDWVGAHPHLELGVILLAASNPRTAAVELEKSEPHELSHLLLSQDKGPAYQQAPHRSDVGLASFAEISASGDNSAQVDEAVSAGSTMPFSELRRTFPLDSDGVLFAYAQSFSLIKFIQLRYGTRALSRMEAELAGGATCHNLIHRSFGMSLDSLNEEWLLRQDPQPQLARIWGDNGFLMFVVAAGFLVSGCLALRMPRSNAH